MLKQEENYRMARQIHEERVNGLKWRGRPSELWLDGTDKILKKEKNENFKEQMEMYEVYKQAKIG